MNFLELGRLLLESLPTMFADPQLLAIVAGLVFLVYLQYERNAAMERRMFGTARTSAGEQTLVSVLYGLIGGALGTIVFILVGVSFTETGIWYIWPASVLLMLIHPRFLCFSYAGGLLSLSSLLLGFPKLDVAAVIALVGVLHLVESVLILTNGHKGAVPVYLKTESGEVVGGFSLQKFWPIPIIALVAVVVGVDGQEIEMISIGMPDWWPLIGSDLEVNESQILVYALLPVMAALGYGDLALAELPREKSRFSAGVLLLYSIAVIGTAVLADDSRGWQFIAALAAPLGHEYVIYLGRRKESRGRPAFVQTGLGVMVLETLPGSPAQLMGLRTGHVITSVNGYSVSTYSDIEKAISPWSVGVELEVVDQLHDKGKIKMTYNGKVPPLGIIPAPEATAPAYMTLSSQFRAGWAVRKLASGFGRFFKGFGK